MSASQAFQEEIHWRYSDSEPNEDGAFVVDFRLVYQGNLLASGNRKPRSPHKQQIRRYFHKQLKRLWELNPALQSLSGMKMGTKGSFVQVDPKHEVSFLSQTADRYKVGDKCCVPIVTKALRLNCSLDILLLRRTEPNRIYSQGDLDGKIKTLMDSLKMPGENDNKEGDENPLFCLVEDDQLITELRLAGDLLLPSEDQLVVSDSGDEEEDCQSSLAQNHALAVIHVIIKTTSRIIANMDF